MKRSCKDCRFYRPTDIRSSAFGDTAKCVAPQVHDIKVEAIRHLPWHYASMLRAYGWYTAWRAGFCGKRGRWWEPRAALRLGSNPPPPDLVRKPLAPAGPPPRRMVWEGIEPRTPYSPPPRPRMPLAFFAAAVVFIVMGLIWSFSAHGADLEFDPKAAQQEKMFKLLAWQTVNCMNAGAMNQIRMGERDSTKLSFWLAKTCGGPFAKYAVNELEIDRERVLRLLLAMAIDAIGNVPGVTMKKP